MHPFSFYLQVGFEHISDLAGYDHILFLVALCAVYKVEEWRRLLVLVTAFTVGHSVTLALVSLGSLSIPSELIEFLIPVTIMLTGIANVIIQKDLVGPKQMLGNYAMALFFGLIHGMGFSNYFRALLMDESEIAIPLLAFNIGLELGQLMVVAVIVGVAFMFLNLLRVRQREWNLFVSGAACGMSLIMMMETKFW
jgi:hydrogenase/urease accessory protein HupE